MAKIKSTLDLIMEKTKHLSLNEEEKGALEQEQLNRRLQALLVPYLKGERDANYLAHELAQFPSETIEDARKLCLELLMDRLSPFEDNQRILGAVERLLGQAGRDLWEKTIAPVEAECREDLRGARQEAADRCRAVLVAAGLKGPALLPRVDEQAPGWKEEQEDRIKAFRASVKSGLEDSHR